MNRKKRLVAVPAIIFLISLLFAGSTALASSFDPDFILSDEELLDASTMTLTDIQNFLDSKGGYIANYTTKNAYGEERTAAEIIYEASTNYDCTDVELSNTPDLAERRRKCNKVTVNPKMLLVLLQKEQSLIEETSPTTRQLDWATGYGCYDGKPCMTRYEGFGKQVNSASLQFSYYLENPNYFPYVAGNTYRLTNSGGRADSLVTPKTQATAALYNYTPHVYNGNYNFFNLWNKYFTRSYPDNSLLQSRGEAGVWLIQDGKKRPFHSKGALTSRYDINKIIQVGKSDLDKYPTGSPIKFAQYSVVKSPMGKIYLLVDDERREFESKEAFRLIGLNPEEVEDVAWEDISMYIAGRKITASSTYPTGALLQDVKTGGIYFVENGEKAPLWDSVLLRTKFKNRAPIQVSSEELNKFKTIGPVMYGDGELLTSPVSPAVYLIEGNIKRPIATGEVFESLGFKWSNVITVSPKLLNLYDNGQVIQSAYDELSGAEYRIAKK